MRLIPIDTRGAPLQKIPNLPAAAVEIGPAYVALYKKEGYEPPWLGYFAVIGESCVGTCGFKSPPRENRVEIAYFTFPEFEGQRLATGMAQQLLDIARDADPRLIIAARTLPMTNASTTILTRLGFQLAGTVIDPDDGEVWEWQWLSV